MYGPGAEQTREPAARWRRAYVGQRRVFAYMAITFPFPISHPLLPKTRHKPAEPRLRAPEAQPKRRLPRRCGLLEWDSAADCGGAERR